MYGTYGTSHTAFVPLNKFLACLKTNVADSFAGTVIVPCRIKPISLAVLHARDEVESISSVSYIVTYGVRGQTALRAYLELLRRRTRRARRRRRHIVRRRSSSPTERPARSDDRLVPVPRRPPAARRRTRRPRHVTLVVVAPAVRHRRQPRRQLRSTAFHHLTRS